jgi:hypothetical protein
MASVWVLNLVTVGGEIRQPFDAKILDELISRFPTAVCEVIAGLYSIIIYKSRNF